MAIRLLGMAESDNVPAYVALQAVNSALDRAGVVEPNQVEVTVKPYEELMGDLTGGSRADYRRAIGDERADDQPPAIETNHRPGGEPTGVRVIGELPDGSLVLDGEVADDAERQADDDQDGQTHLADHHDAEGDYQPGRQTFANPLTPTTPVRGYLPADEAMEVAADANRAHRYRMTRR